MAKYQVEMQYSDGTTELDDELIRYRTGSGGARIIFV